MSKSKAKRAPKPKAAPFDGTGIAPTPELMKRMGEQAGVEIATAVSKRGRQSITAARVVRVTVFSRVVPFLSPNEVTAAERLVAGHRAIERASGEGSASTWGMRTGGGGKPRDMPVGLLELDAIRETREVMAKLPGRMRRIVRDVVLAESDAPMIAQAEGIMPGCDKNQALPAIVGAVRACLWMVVDIMADLEADRARRVRAARSARSPGLRTSYAAPG